MFFLFDMVRQIIRLELSDEKRGKVERKNL